MSGADVGQTQDRGRAEALRKVIHALLSLAAAGLLWTQPTADARRLLLAVALLALALDGARLRLPAFERLFRATVGRLFRAHERRRLSGASTLAVGFAIVAGLFEPGPAIGGILYVGLADAAAAIVGTRWGRTRLRAGRSLEGTLAFALVAFAIGWLIPWLSLPVAALVAASLTAVELAPIAADDNLSICIAGAALLWIFS